MDNNVLQVPAQGPNILGLPLDLWGIILGVVAVVFYLYFRSSVKSIPTDVLWGFKNYTARRFRAREDLNGIFLDLLNARGKVLENIKREGEPIDVTEIDEKRNRAYLAKWKDEKGVEQKKVFLNVSSGGLKHSRLYMIVEGTGKTLDMIDKAKPDTNGGQDSGNSVLLHEERGAGKVLFKDFAEAMAGTFKALILPMIAGGGITASVIIIILLLSGHLH